MDTWLGNNRDPITLHKYLYANVDPGNMVDPSGHMGLGQVMAAVRIVGVQATQAVVIFSSRINSSPIGKAIKATGALAIGALLKSEIKKCYRSKGKKCRIPNLVVIGSNLHQESQQHIKDAISGNGSNGIPISAFVTYKKGANKDRKWLSKTEECKGKTGNGTGKDCDEYPFAASREGGQKRYRSKQVSLRPIDSCDNQCAGRVWGRAVGKGKSGDKYLIAPYGNFSFYYSNGKFGM
jgi:hypothetical protein